MKIVIASNNAKKRREIEKILSTLNISVVSAEETQCIDVIEDGETFAENAKKKAEAFSIANKLPALADDSGLCVAALADAPGVFSSRYAGENASDAENNAKLLEAMKGIENRTAHFVCSLCLVFPDGQASVTAEGNVNGYILSEPDGAEGFGYDPLFHSLDLHKSFAVADAKEKASVSHRGRALRSFAEKLAQFV